MVYTLLKINFCHFNNVIIPRNSSDSQEEVEGRFTQKDDVRIPEDIRLMDDLGGESLFCIFGTLLHAVFSTFGIGCLLLTN